MSRQEGHAYIENRYTNKTVAEYYDGKRERKNPVKRPKKAKSSKRISAALTRFLKKQNPGKMKGVKAVRVKKLKDGGITIRPAH